jgi:L-threonylcarbamoyladenylate synthase
MAQIITKEYIEQNPEIIERIKTSIFVYPTDTIYGIGCDARNEELVARIREIKKRNDVPFSIITPSKDLIRAHCEMTPEIEQGLEKLPGPYTLILPVKKPFVAKNVSFDGKSIGVRMIDSWFQEIVTRFNFPVITTSVNVHRKPHMTSVKDIDKDIKKEVDFIIDDGEHFKRPSQLINFIQQEQPEEHQFY